MADYKLNISIIGAGESGVGAAILAKKKGYNVFVSEKNRIEEAYLNKLLKYQIDYEQEGHNISKILQSDMVIKSPGVPKECSVIRKITEKGIKVISEVEFAFQHTKAFIIAITGSNGKTTTTKITYQIIKDAGYDIGLAGNIGMSFAEQVALEDKTYYVLEISSFQLDNIKKFKPDIAVLTNITSDHLERYDYNFEKYKQAKFKITENQTADNFFIYDTADNTILEHMKTQKILAQKIPFSTTTKSEKGIHLQDDQIHVNLERQYHMDTNLFFSKANHNLRNTMAAMAVAEVLKISKDIIRQSLERFSGVEHRLEDVGIKNNVLFINDSKATNINATFCAIESMTRPTVWIVGGIDKGNDYKQLYPLVWDKVKSIVCLGKDNQEIIDSFSKIVPEILETQSMEEAVSLSYGLAEEGDTVLLSPACASFDLFKNYEDRGQQFKDKVREL